MLGTNLGLWQNLRPGLGGGGGGAPAFEPNLVLVTRYFMEPPATPLTYNKFTIAFRFQWQAPSPDSFSKVFTNGQNNGLVFGTTSNATSMRATVKDNSKNNIYTHSFTQPIDTAVPVSIVASFDFTNSGALGADVVGKTRVSTEPATFSTPFPGGGIADPDIVMADIQSFQFAFEEIIAHDFVWISFTEALDPDDPLVWAGFFDTSNNDEARDLSGGGVINGVTPDLLMTGDAATWQAGVNQGSASVPVFTYISVSDVNALVTGSGEDLTFTVNESETEFTVTITEPAADAGTYGPYLMADLEAGPINIVPPSASGTTGLGDTLSANFGIWVYDGDGSKPFFSYRWLRTGTEVGADADYTITADDLTEGLNLEVTALTTGGTSTATAEVVEREFPAELDVDRYDIVTPTPAPTYDKFTVAMRVRFDPAPSSFEKVFSADDNSGVSLGFKGDGENIRWSVKDGSDTLIAELISTQAITTTSQTVSIVASVDYTASGDLGTDVVAAIRISGEPVLTATDPGGIVTPVQNPANWTVGFAQNVIVYDFIWISYNAALDPSNSAVWDGFFDSANNDEVRDLLQPGALVVDGVTPDLARAGSAARWLENVNLGSADTPSDPNSGVTQL